MTLSTTAEISSDDLLEYILTSCFNNGKWKGIAHGYILHWLEQVQLYHENSQQQFEDQTLKKFLRNAFMEVPEFDSIRTTEEINFNQTGNRLTYKQYVGALTATAQRVDKSKTLLATRPRRSPRNVYLHDIDDNEDVYLDAEDDNSNNHSNEHNYDINTTVFEISKASSNPKARLPPQAWFGLSSEGKCTWDNLNDRDKASLIESLTKPQ